MYMFKHIFIFISTEMIMVLEIPLRLLLSCDVEFVLLVMAPIRFVASILLVDEAPNRCALSYHCDLHQDYRRRVFWRMPLTSPRP